jgi:serine/threonine protein kinase
MPMISWIGAVVLMFAAIVPSTPGKTLVTGLFAASMNPVGMLIAKARGMWDFGPTSNVLLMHYPDYVLVGVAVVISHVVTQLGQHVGRAREMGSYQLGELLGRGRFTSCARFANRWKRRTSGVWCTGTSSPPTSTSAGLDSTTISSRCSTSDWSSPLRERVPRARWRRRVGMMTPGTPAYIAPEMVLGEPVDGRADLYALGCVAYYLLTGHLVFEGTTAIQMIARHLHDAPVPPSQRSELPVPAALDQLVLTCLAKKPQDRPPSAAALALAGSDRCRSLGRAAGDALVAGEPAWQIGAHDGWIRLGHRHSFLKIFVPWLSK